MAKLSFGKKPPPFGDGCAKRKPVPPLRACSKGPIDPSGGSGNCRATYGADGAPGFFDGDGGISRGTNALRIETRGSHRDRSLEPYTGLAFQVEWPAASDRFFVPSGALEGVVNTIPPLQAEATVGLAVIPWEQRARYQRFTLDFRGTFAYTSEGRSWSPLFDALENCLARLPDSLRETINAYYYEGRTGDEVATRLDVAPAAVRKRLQRARTLLTQCLETQHGPPPLPEDA